MQPRSAHDQGSGGVDPAAARRRSSILPGEVSLDARKGDVEGCAGMLPSRSEKSAEAVVAQPSLRGAVERRAERRGERSHREP
jgi:hypothetical protein